MFPAVWCWSAGALWAVTRLARKPDIVGWSVLAFSVYSLLMTAYPQPVVFHAYILGGYGLYLAYRKQRLESHAAGRFLALVATALIAGIALALPVYIDLANISAESARVAPAPSFFTVVLPKFGSFTDAVRFFVLGTAPELFGNPVGAGFPFPYDGLSVTPVVVFFAVIGLRHHQENLGMVAGYRGPVFARLCSSVLCAGRQILRVQPFSQHPIGQHHAASHDHCGLWCRCAS